MVGLISTTTGENVRPRRLVCNVAIAGADHRGGGIVKPEPIAMRNDDVAEHAGEQRAVRIRQLDAHLHRSRGLIDDRIDEHHLAGERCAVTMKEMTRWPAFRWPHAGSSYWKILACIHTFERSATTKRSFCIVTY